MKIHILLFLFIILVTITITFFILFYLFQPRIGFKYHPLDLNTHKLIIGVNREIDKIQEQCKINYPQIGQFIKQYIIDAGDKLEALCNSDPSGIINPISINLQTAVGKYIQSLVSEKESIPIGTTACIDGIINYVVKKIDSQFPIMCTKYNSDINYKIKLNKISNELVIIFNAIC